MRGRMVTVRWGTWDPAALRSAALVLCLAAGALAGHLYAGACGGETGAALRAYLLDFCSVYDVSGAAASMLSCAALYFGYAALLLLFGFSSAGVALIPALAWVFGFMAMYTVSCFVGTFGRPGVLLAIGLLLVRMLFTLPCFLALAGPAWALSTELFLMSFGRGKRSAPVQYGSRYFLLFLVCAVVPALGVCCERLLTPLLFRLAVARVLPGI